MSRVFVVNCGSSSLKYRLVDVAAGEALASGLAERIGQPAGRLTHTRPGADPDVTEEPQLTTSTRPVTTGPCPGAPGPAPGWR